MALWIAESMKGDGVAGNGGDQRWAFVETDHEVSIGLGGLAVDFKNALIGELTRNWCCGCDGRGESGDAESAECGFDVHDDPLCCVR